MKHPLQRLSTGVLRKTYGLFLLLTALVAIGMGELAKYAPEGGAVDAPKATVPTIKYEFANTPEKWAALATVSGTAGLDALRRQTYLDMLFALSYSTAIAVGAIGIARGAQHRAVVTCAPWVAWGAWVAGGLDVVENGGMLINISDPVSSFLLQLTLVCATVKFALVAVGVLFVLFLLPLPWREELR